MLTAALTSDSGRPDPARQKLPWADAQVARVHHAAMASAGPLMEDQATSGRQLAQTDRVDMPRRETSARRSPCLLKPPVRHARKKTFVQNAWVRGRPVGYRRP
jgi:hypothetical protein